jgi:glycosyltransferase involved in cell wall biosynthesis
MEQFVLRLASAQQRDGHQLAVLALNTGPLAEQADPALQVNILKGGRKWNRLAETATLLKRLQPDIVHAHNPTSLHYAVLGKLLCGAHVVMTDHAPTRGVVRRPGVLERRTVSTVVAVSHDTARLSADYKWRQPPMVIHNGVELKSASIPRAAMRRHLNLDGQFVGIMVAGFDKVKGHAFLLQALAALRDRALPVVMLIAGEGAERANMEQLARELRLGPEQVRFLGRRADIVNLLAASDFFVLPSLMEGLPLAILEAMSQKLPVIATPVGGVPELLEPERHGLLVKPGDAADLADAIARLKTDPALCKSLGKAGYDRVCREFTFDVMTRKYEDIYYTLRPR